MSPLFLLLSVFSLLLLASPALADWGEPWGTMIWGLPVAVPQLPSQPHEPQRPPHEPGFDYLRAHTGYSAAQMTRLASPRPWSGRRRHAAAALQICVPPAAAAAVPSGWGHMAPPRPGLIIGETCRRRASAQPPAPAEVVHSGPPRRFEPLGEASSTPSQPARKGRRAVAVSLNEMDSGRRRDAHDA